MVTVTRSTKRENLRLRKTVEQLKDPENLKRYSEAAKNCGLFIEENEINQ